MPCTAKKAEIKPEHFTEGKQDVDYVPQQQVTRMIQEAGIDLPGLNRKLDMPFGLHPVPGNLWCDRWRDRSCSAPAENNSSSEVLDAISFTGIRGVDGIKEASVDLNGREVKLQS